MRKKYGQLGETETETDKETARARAVFCSIWQVDTLSFSRRISRGSDAASAEWPRPNTQRSLHFCTLWILKIIVRMMTVTPLLMVNLLMVMPITITIITLIEKVTSRVEKNSYSTCSSCRWSMIWRRFPSLTLRPTIWPSRPIRGTQWPLTLLTPRPLTAATNTRKGHSFTRGLWYGQ